MNLKQAWQAAMNCKSITESTTDTQYRLDINHEDKIIIVSIQGSVSFQDWIQNFNFIKEIVLKFNNGKLSKPFKSWFFMHAGFKEKYFSIKDNLHKNIDPLLTQGYKLNVFGFSQGASLTVATHEDFWYYLDENNLDQDLLHSYAFAPARVFSMWGFWFLKKRFGNLTLIISRRDIVPKVPLVIMGFLHYGKKHKLGKWRPTFPWQWYKEHMSYKEQL